MAGTRIIEQWFKGHFGKPENEFDRTLDQRLGELERTLGEWYQALRFGPVPGSYLALQWHQDQATVGTVDAVVLPPVSSTSTGGFELRPIHFGSATSSGNVSGNIVIRQPDGATQDLLTVDFVANLHEGFNRRGDFTVEKIVFDPSSDPKLPPVLELDVRSEAGGGFITCVLIVKQVSQVEP